jgi:hypothetical protein
LRGHATTFTEHCSFGHFARVRVNDIRTFDFADEAEA